MKESISIIVPMYNEGTHIANCLSSILAEMEENDEIIVVDNGSTDDSIEVAGTFKKVKVLSLPGKNISAVRNFGVKQSKGDILAFLDADCILSPGWRAGLVRVLSDGSVGSTGSKCDIPQNASWIERAWYSQRSKKPGRVKYINSGNLVVRRSVFDQVGGFNENLITGEDAELGWRIHQRGFLMLEDPQVRAIHLGNPKNIVQFYKREKWHGIGMLGTFKISPFDKPLIMTTVFLISMVFALFLSPVLMERQFGIVALMGLVGWVPFLTALYRSVQYKSISYLGHLMILYFVYFLARSHSLVILSLGMNSQAQSSRTLKRPEIKEISRQDS